MRIQYTFVLLFLLITLSYADEEPGEMPLFVQPQAKKLTRCSLAKIKALKIFHVGHASLYAENCNNLLENFFASEKQLSFQYFRKIPGDAFSKAAENFLKKNLSEQEFTGLHSKIIKFNSHYQDIKNGDRYELHYSPENGLCLYLNGVTLYQETDALFSQAYFSIWLGEKPYSETLKKELLNLDD